MKKLLLILLILPTLSSALVTTYSNVNCGKWLDLRKGNLANQKNLANQSEQRAVGFFDGLVRANGFDAWDKPTKITPSQLFYMIDNECRANPASKVQDSILKIFIGREG